MSRLPKRRQKAKVYVWKWKKKHTQRGRDSVGIEIFEKGLEARGAASTREYTCLYIIMTEGEKRTE